MANQIRFPVIIPSALETTGLGRKYFEKGHVNLLPLVHKTLIEYLINDLTHRDKEVAKRIGDIYLITNEEEKENYKDLLRDVKQLHIEAEPPYEEKGIFHTIEWLVEKEGINKPFLVINGDSLFQDNFLDTILKQAQDCLTNNDRCIVIGLIKDTDRTIEKQEKYYNFDYDLRINRWGYYYVKKLHPMQGSKEFNEITKKDIVDIMNTPCYPELHLREDWIPLVETGAFIFSKGSWDSLKKEAKRRDPLGYYSTINIIRRALIDNYNGIDIRGVVAEKREHWIDINYPWEYLIVNDYLATRLVTKYKEAGEKNPDLDDTKYTVMLTPEELTRKFPYTPKHPRILPSDKLKLKYTNEHDSEYAWGIHRNAIIENPVIVPDPDKVRDAKIFIGQGAHIKGCCVLGNGSRIREHAIVTNSIIGEKVLVDVFALVDHSVIMAGSHILAHSSVPYSIIGKNVLMGGNAMVTCENLDRFPASREKACGEYYSNIRIVPYLDRFSTVIGDNTKIGTSVYILPGRKLGKDCKIYPGLEIRRNYPPKSTVKREAKIEYFEE